MIPGALVELRLIQLRLTDLDVAETATWVGGGITARSAMEVTVVAAVSEAKTRIQTLCKGVKAKLSGTNDASVLKTLNWELAPAANDSSAYEIEAQGRALRGVA